MSSDRQLAMRHEALLKRPIDGQALKHLVDASLTWLRTNQQTVNSLNVFPVPDGDTGTNMHLTMRKAYEEVSKLQGEPHGGRAADAVARGALMGARGNSGVILSQLRAGFAEGSKHLETLISLTESGSKTAIFFLIFRLEAASFAPHFQIDSHFSRLFYKAISNGVSVYPIMLSYRDETIYFVKQIPIRENLNSY